MNNKKTFILILGLVFILILVAFIQFMALRSGDKSLAPTRPIKQVSPEPKSNQQSQEDFAVVSVSPNIKSPFTDRFQPIEITFNKPLNEGIIPLSLTPQNNIKTQVSQTKLGYSFLEIIPIEPWTDNQNYQMILSKNIQTEDGIKLGKDYIINFRVQAYLGL